MTVYSHRRFGDIDVVALDRHGGVSSGDFESLNLAAYVGDNADNVHSNIGLVAEVVDSKNVAVLRAEHGNVVHHVSGINGIHELPPGDGAVTQIADTSLLALSADCVAGAIVNPVNHVIGVFHAGWKGVLARVVDETWQQMTQLGAHQNAAHAVLGPSICGTCYEVDTERVDMFRGNQPECVVDDRHLDIGAGIRAQLNSLGIQTEVIAGCTCEDENLFSYRRANGKPTGRGGLIVSMRSTS